MISFCWCVWKLLHVLKSCCSHQSPLWMMWHFLCNSSSLNTLWFTLAVSSSSSWLELISCIKMLLTSHNATKLISLSWNLISLWRISIVRWKIRIPFIYSHLHFRTLYFRTPIFSRYSRLCLDPWRRRTLCLMSLSTSCVTIIHHCLLP